MQFCGASFLESARSAAECARRNAHHALTVCHDDEDRVAYWMRAAGSWMAMAYTDYDRAHARIARASRRAQRAS